MIGTALNRSILATSNSMSLLAALIQFTVNSVPSGTLIDAGIVVNVQSSWAMIVTSTTPPSTMPPVEEPPSEEPPSVPVVLSAEPELSAMPVPMVDADVDADADADADAEVVSPVPTEADAPVLSTTSVVPAAVVGAPVPVAEAPSLADAEAPSPSPPQATDRIDARRAQRDGRNHVGNRTAR